MGLLSSRHTADCREDDLAGSNEIIPIPHLISDMLNTHRDDIAYNMIDADKHVSDEQAEKIRKIDGIVLARALPPLST